LKVIGIGNPILDLTIHVEKELVLKHGLKENNAIMADGDTNLMSIIHEFKQLKECKRSPGGATQNTMRQLAKVLRNL